MRKLPQNLIDYSPTNQATSARLSLESNGNAGFPSSLAFVLQEVRREVGLEGKKQDDTSNSLSSREINQVIERVASRIGFELSAFEKDQILTQLEKEQKPFGILQELVDNIAVTDIIISSFSKISVQKGRKNYVTDLHFPNEDAYLNFVERLLQRAGTSYSTKKPIADGMIGSFARIHAVHQVLCENGPYVTVRLNRFSTVNTEDLIVAGLAPKPIFEYLCAIMETGGTLLLAGEVGTGKTTLARALASAIPLSDSILVIEDTQEIRLEHPHVRYLTTREANTDGAGRVSPSECIRAGMRMAMNRIIFGEIRDAEAGEAFIDVCASGHPGLSTIHSRSALEAVTRLELFLGRAQKGVAQKILQEQIATAIQVIVYIGICKDTGKRRILDVREIGPVADGVLRQREIFRYDYQNLIPHWRVVNRVSAHRGSLENRSHPVILTSLPASLELSLDVLYGETRAA